MNYLLNNKPVQNQENYWDVIKVSDVNDKIIHQLINVLKVDLSEDFFISLESLTKLGDKARPAIESVVDEIDEQHNFKKEIFTNLLNFFKKGEVDKPLMFKLLHSDFIVRARSIMNIVENNEVIKYLVYLIPLLDDPDHSVRFTAVNALLRHLDLEIVKKALRSRIKKENNPIIKRRIIENLH